MNIMTVNAEAVWNEEKCKWECKVSTVDKYENVKGEPCEETRTIKCDIEACDELVLPMAILECNGISADKVFLK